MSASVLFAQDMSAPDAVNPESAFVLGETPAAEAPSGVSSTFAIVRILIVLALVAAAVYGVVLFMKRGSRQNPTDSPHLKVLAQTPLTTRSTVSVVAVGPQAWLVGSGESGAALIAEITDRETVDAMLLEASQRTPLTGGRLVDFAALLRRFGIGTVGTAGTTGAAGANAANTSTPPAVPRHSERLRGL